MREETDDPVASDNTSIPAGFTYLGQFIDHDITFDPVSKLDERYDPEALVNFRTPRFDLDSVYGSGPDDQPFLYDWESEPPGAKLLVGRPPTRCRGRGLRPADLPRNRQGRALIGDARNDENVIVAQLHLLFIRFHNAVVDHLAARGRTLAGRSCSRRRSGSCAGTTSGSSSTSSCRRSSARRWRMRCSSPPRSRRARGSTQVLQVEARAVHPGRVLRRGVPLRPQHGARRTTVSSACLPAGLRRDYRSSPPSRSRPICPSTS